MSKAISSRAFQVDDSETIVTLYIHAPRPIVDGEEPAGTWRCRYEIDGLTYTVQDDAFGVDSLAALTVCIALASIRLRRLARTHRLMWLNDPDLGLPTLSWDIPQPTATNEDRQQ